MTNRKNHIVKFILILFSLVCVGAILIFSLLRQGDNKEEWKDFEASLHNNENIIDGVIKAGTAYLITSRSGDLRYGDTFSVYTQKSNKEWQRIYENDFVDLKPWKLEIGDVDGDGIDEILTGIFRTAYYDKEIKNRMFIFNYSEGKLIKKWTGSEIAGEWKDFIVNDFVPIKGDELIFIRKTEDGERVCIYYWFKFGFFKLGESEDYQEIEGIFVKGENRLEIRYQEAGKEKKAILIAKDNNLIEIRE